MSIVEIHAKGDKTSSSQSGNLKPLDRSKWHHPLVSIIVTHYNYSPHLTDALLSIVDQTHENWECVVVDDCSITDQSATAERIVASLGTDKIRFHPLRENVGQIPAFYAGLDQTSGEFVCLLDPDDRYAKTFLEESVRAHLNPVVYCPAVCSEQILLRNGSITAGVFSPFNQRYMQGSEVPSEVEPRLTFFPPGAGGWQWTSTSSLMLRRPALELMRPRKKLAYKRSADSYLAQGAHALGGGLFLNRPLVYRQIHASNSWLTDELFSMDQEKRRPHRVRDKFPTRADALEAIKANGGEHHIARRLARKSIFKRWQYSIIKRLRRATLRSSAWIFCTSVLTQTFLAGDEAASMLLL